MKRFLRNNINFFVFLVFAFIFESVTLFILSETFFIKSPWFALSLLGIIFSFYNLFKSRIAKNIILYICVVTQTILGLFSVVLYDNTGTLFDFNMFQLVGESTTFLGTLTLNYLYIIFSALFLITFIILINFLNKFQDKYYSFNFSSLISSVCLVVFLVCHTSVVIVSNRISEKNFMKKLYIDSNEKYILYGQSSNFFNEIYKFVFFNNYNDLKHSDIEKYIYKETSVPTEKFAVSEGNNLITILVESFEWFSFVSDPSIYPNGTNIDESVLDELFPNIRNFYNMSMVMNNHYVQNKTDMSEDEALLGVYPSSDYINYVFPKNTYPTSIANTLKSIDENIITNYAHNNIKTYYNRNKMMKSLGYDNLYFIDEMAENGATDYMNSTDLSHICMNLDSEMIESMKDNLFLKDQRFITHLTTISTHGHFLYRKTMQKWLDKMNDLDVSIENETLRNYVSYTMEFDHALGLLLEDLEKKDLLDKTTIVIFSDHNTYLNDLSYTVKGIKYKDYSADNYIELFRVPLMIYDANIGHQIINKFTTTYDITPTILDMFGINYYTNLYYGHSIFSEEESILYSKAFDIFIADDILFSNINNILYKGNSLTNEYIDEIETKAKTLLQKIYYTNHIFDYDFFTNDNYDVYMENFNNIN